MPFLVDSTGHGQPVPSMPAGGYGGAAMGHPVNLNMPIFLSPSGQAMQQSVGSVLQGVPVPSMGGPAQQQQGSGSMSQSSGGGGLGGHQGSSGGGNQQPGAPQQPMLSPATMQGFMEHLAQAQAQAQSMQRSGLPMPQMPPIPPGGMPPLPMAAGVRPGSGAGGGSGGGGAQGSQASGQQGYSQSVSSRSASYGGDADTPMQGNHTSTSELGQVYTGSGELMHMSQTLPPRHVAHGHAMGPTGASPGPSAPYHSGGLGAGGPRGQGHGRSNSSGAPRPPGPYAIHSGSTQVGASAPPSVAGVPATTAATSHTPSSGQHSSGHTLPYATAGYGRPVAEPAHHHTASTPTDHTHRARDDSTPTHTSGRGARQDGSQHRGDGRRGPDSAGDLADVAGSGGSARKGGPRRDVGDSSGGGGSEEEARAGHGPPARERHTVAHYDAHDHRVGGGGERGDRGEHARARQDHDSGHPPRGGAPRPAPLHPVRSLGTTASATVSPASSAADGHTLQSTGSMPEGHAAGIPPLGSRLSGSRLGGANRHTREAGMGEEASKAAARIVGQALHGVGITQRGSGNMER